MAVQKAIRAETETLSTMLWWKLLLMRITSAGMVKLGLTSLYGLAPISLMAWTRNAYLYSDDKFWTM